MKIALSPEEKTDLEYRHQHERDKRISDRIKAVLLRDEGWSVSKIAQALRLHNDTVFRYFIEYTELNKLTPNHHGSEQKLNGEQTTELLAHLQEHLYDKARAIVDYVKLTYCVEYTVAGMTDWLKRHKFSYKQPKGHPYKADADRQKEFVDMYEELKKVTPKDEPILFMDAVHPTMETKISRGWIAKGAEKLLPTTASRTRVNIAGTIELSTMKIIANQYETINAKSIITLFSNVKVAYPNASQFHIILDQSGYHRSAALSSFAEENGIKLHFLPPYSPNLNPIERVWKLMNECTRNNRFFKSAKEFRERFDDFFENKIPTMTDVLRCRINDNFHIVDTAKSF
jgi:transposase